MSKPYDYCIKDKDKKVLTRSNSILIIVNKYVELSKEKEGIEIYNNKTGKSGVESIINDLRKEYI